MTQQTINILIGIICTIGGWWLKIMYETLKDLQTEDKELADKVSKIEVLVAGGYVSKHDFLQTLQTLFNKLDRIEEKLDKKVDK